MANGEKSTYDNLPHYSCTGEKMDTKELHDRVKKAEDALSEVQRNLKHIAELTESIADNTPGDHDHDHVEALSEHYVADLLPRKGGELLTAAFIDEVVRQLLDYLRTQSDSSTKVLEFHEPVDMKAKLEKCLTRLDEPHNLRQLLDDIQLTLHYCVRTGHPHFFNQLSTGLDVTSMVGEWITACVNTNMFTYEIAPTFVLMEDLLLKTMREYIWKDIEGDGIFAPGGALSNFYALLVARHKRFPTARNEGVRDLPRTVIFTSENAHFSVERSAEMAGHGLDSVIKIRCDSRGKMDVKDLEDKIVEAEANGWFPLMVAATAGTTVLGAFDPLDAVAEVCRLHGIWFHVDAAWGGGVLMSRKHRHLLKGIEHADSVTWNPHKIMCATLQCSAFLLKEKGLLESCNALNATYLYQKDKHYDTDYDTGDKAIQCGRRNDAFKLWLMFRAKGAAGFEAHVDRMFELSHYLYNKAKSTEGFEMVMDHEPEYLNVSFWYVPKCLRDSPVRDFEWNRRLNCVAPRIKEKMMKAGALMVGYQPLGDKPNFFRPVLSNPALSQTDCDFLLNELARLGEAIVV